MLEMHEIIEKTILEIPASFEIREIIQY